MTLGRLKENKDWQLLLLQPFNGLFSRTTWISRYQRGKTNLDFTGARYSEWQWHQLGHIQVCTSLQTDNLASTPPLSFFTGRMLFLQSLTFLSPSLNMGPAALWMCGCDSFTMQFLHYDGCVFSVWEQIDVWYKWLPVENKKTIFSTDNEWFIVSSRLSHLKGTRHNQCLYQRQHETVDCLNISTTNSVKCYSFTLFATKSWECSPAESSVVERGATWLSAHSQIRFLQFSSTLTLPS